MVVHTIKEVREHVKQAGIYSAMSGIVAVESVNE